MAIVGQSVKWKIKRFYSFEIMPSTQQSLTRRLSTYLLFSVFHVSFSSNIPMLFTFHSFLGKFISARREIFLFHNGSEAAESKKEIFIVEIGLE